ncbi:Tripartite tricarboxylate transporter TctB family protein [Marinomonas spartinae]|uniref:Tripartite tricarboxylate transporter TctB family protein n=1 Tax=Marinomonas spartinae TaxID=1792290 RepID=A0A1A8TPV2_9GAMM|nr:tripartite tricarboxylate transporter TctB family protein [Marinomonas spartinae]SBS36293.1 Tripartite tricarboxylate transporter TctB family protein [Marinomonas spartinae]
MSSPSLRKPGEVVFSLLLVVFSLFVFWQAYKIAGFSSMSSAGAFPMAASFAMLLSSCFIFVKTLRTPKAQGMRFFYHCLPPVVAFIMAIILIYAVLLNSVGFTLTSFAFLFICIQTLHRRSPFYTFALSLITLIVVYIVFRLIFQVVLPEGIVPEDRVIAVIKSLWS